MKLLQYLSFLLLIILAACTAPASNPSSITATLPVPTSTFLPTSTSTEIPIVPTEAATATSTKVDIFDRSTLPPEMKAYLNSLPTRTPAETGSDLETKYLNEDRSFHDQYLDDVKSYLKSIGVDISSIEAFSRVDWENYDNAIKAYELLWKQLAQDPENYNTNWVLTPWLIRGDGKTNLGMYDPKNFVKSIDANYGFGSDPRISQENFIKIFPGAKNLQEAMDSYKQEFKKYGFSIPISGIKTEIQRQFVSGQYYGVQSAVADHTDYPDGSVKIIIIGSQDENGKWVYQPFTVNLVEKQTGSGDYFANSNGVFPAGEGSTVTVVGNKEINTLSRIEYTITDLINMINHAVYVDTSKGLIGTNKSLSFFSCYFLDGTEMLSVIQDGGVALVSPLSQ